MDDIKTGTKVRAWGKDLYVTQVRDDGYWLSESTTSSSGWYATQSDIDHVFE